MVRITPVVNIAGRLSALFRPSYYPTVCVALVLALSLSASTRGMDWGARLPVVLIALFVTLVVFTLTITLPLAAIHVYLRLTHTPRRHLRRRQERIIPYLINILCYMLCLEALTLLGVPGNLSCIIVASLLLQATCTVVTPLHKVSLHAAAAAGLVGTLLGYAKIYNFNPTLWLCAGLLLWGCVATSRMILRTHTLSEVLLGSLLGLTSAYLGIVHTTMWINSPPLSLWNL